MTIREETAGETANTDNEILEPVVQDLGAMDRTISTILAREVDAAIPGLPLHESLLIQQPPETAEALANVYFGTTMTEFDRVVGKEIPVLGMCLYWHGPYTSKADGSSLAGYYELRILCDKQDEDGRYIVVKSTSESLIKHGLYVIRHRGMFLFDQPVVYRFSKGAANNHVMTNLSDEPKSALRSFEKH